MIDNSNFIHPTAIISSEVKMGKNNVIQAYAVLEGNIRIGDSNFIGVGCLFRNNISIGNHNHFVGYCSIGSEGEMGTKGDIVLEDTQVQIGNHNKIREYVTINAPVRRNITAVGNHCYIMARCHIPHDAILHDYVIMATNSLIGGGCEVDNHVYIGLGSMTHQWLNIGESAMIGMLAANTKHILPFCTVIGSPSKILKLNAVGAERRGFEKPVIEQAEKYLNDIILLKKEFSFENPIIQTIQDFIKKNGINNCLQKFYQIS